VTLRSPLDRATSRLAVSRHNRLFGQLSIERTAMTNITTFKLSRPVCEKILLCLVVLLGPLASSTGAQSRSATDGTTPLALTSGAPAGSYALGGFENVNPYNGNLNFSLPMLGMSGRGETAYPMMLKIERHWRVEHEILSSEGVGCDPAGPCPSSYYDIFHPSPDSWSAIPAAAGTQRSGTLQTR